MDLGPHRGPVERADELLQRRHAESDLRSLTVDAKELERGPSGINRVYLGLLGILGYRIQ